MNEYHITSDYDYYELHVTIIKKNYHVHTRNKNNIYIQLESVLKLMDVKSVDDFISQKKGKVSAIATSIIFDTREDAEQFADWFNGIVMANTLRGDYIS